MSTSSKPEIVFLGGARTPFGGFGGSLKSFTATDLGVVAGKAAIERSGITPEDVHHVLFGNVLQTSVDAIYLARHIGLRCGVPVPTPALTLNRLCGSGFQAVVSGAHEIMAGDAEICLVGGAESMSQAPHVIRGARWGIPLGKSTMEDSLMASLTDSYCGTPMAITAENLAEQYQISRQECDELGYRSQDLARTAWANGTLAHEVVPVEIPGKKGSVTLFERDEHFRQDVSLEAMARLAPVFKKDGVVTAGNASGICDGAAALVISTAGAASARGLAPLGRLVSWGVAGVEPRIMGIGPVEAAKQALKRAGLTLDAMDLIEINEAFAPQYLACEKELSLDRSKVNVNGGAIAVGHPLGASGARLTLTLLLELRRRKAKYGLAAACIGGGQGIALVVEAFA
jgi:acetyl-CoA acyltransferase 2